MPVRASQIRRERPFDKVLPTAYSRTKRSLSPEQFESQRSSVAHASEPTVVEPSSTTPALASVKERLTADEVIVLTVLAVSAFVMVLSELAMGIALPQVMDDMSITASTGQWLTTAYALTMAVVIPSTGFLMQRFTTRRLFAVSLVLFSVGTAVVAAAPVFEVLLGGRIIQALGTAILLPLLTTTAFQLAPPAHRGRIMAVTTAVTASAGAIGPAVAGIVIAQLSWRWIFLFVLPLALLALIIGGIKMRNFTTPVPVKIDLLSLLLAAVGFAAVLWGLSTTGESVGSASLTVSLIVLGVGLLVVAAFVVRQRFLQRKGAVLLDVRVYKARGFGLANVIFVLLVMTAFGVNVVLPLVFQNVLGLNAFETGLLLVPGGAAMAVTAALVGRLYEPMGPRVLVVFGALLTAAAWAVMSTVDTGTPIGEILALHVIISIGLAFMWTPIFTFAMAALPSDLLGHGSATLNTLQQLGGAAGIAVLIAVLTVVSGQHSDGGTTTETLTGMRAVFITSGIFMLNAAVLGLFLPRLQRNGRDAKIAEGQL